MTGKKLEIKITEMERAFIDAYIENGYNATRAYMHVNKKVKYGSARALSSKLLTKVNIREAIEKEFELRVMGRNEVLSRLSEMARASFYPFTETNEQEGTIFFDFSSPEAKKNLHLIKSLVTKRTRRVVGKGEDAEAWEDEFTRVELHDAKDALKLIGEHENLFKPEKGEGETFTAPQVVEIIKTYEDKRGK